jgi:hypothetical protein
VIQAQIPSTGARQWAQGGQAPCAAVYTLLLRAPFEWTDGFAHQMLCEGSVLHAVRRDPKPSTICHESIFFCCLTPKITRLVRSLKKGWRVCNDLTLIVL